MSEPERRIRQREKRHTYKENLSRSVLFCALPAMIAGVCPPEHSHALRLSQALQTACKRSMGCREANYSLLKMGEFI